MHFFTDFFALDSKHIICYCGIAFCFFVAWQIGNEINPKSKAKTAAGNEQQKRS